MGTLKDLNKHLFNQLDRLSSAKKDELETEIQRADAMQKVSSEIIDAHKTQLDAVKLVAQYKGLNSNQATPQIGVGDMGIEV